MVVVKVVVYFLGLGVLEVQFGKNESFK